MARFQLASKRRYFLLAAATLVAAAALTASTFFTPLGLNQNNSLAKAADAKTALPAEIRIGYFANLTHAPALIAAQRGLWQEHLPGVKITPFVLSGGPQAIEAIKGGALDVAYIGPSPAIIGFNSTGGSLLKIVSGVAHGGAQFVTRPGIESVADLRGGVFATPALGGTQDVALRAFLLKNGLVVNRDAAVVPTENSTTLAQFKAGRLDGAWLPEPWASRLVIDGGAKVFLDEADLWPQGEFATTVLIAKTSFLELYPRAVAAIEAANLAATDFIAANRDLAKELVQAELFKQTGKKLADRVIARAWPELNFDIDPHAVSIIAYANMAKAAGLLKQKTARLEDIFADGKLTPPSDSGR